jgi:hypothetical protein
VAGVAAVVRPLRRFAVVDSMDILERTVEARGS